MTYSVSEILAWIAGRWVNQGAVSSEKAEAIRIQRPASLAGSRSHEVSFFFSRAFEAELPQAKPGILIVGEPFVEPLRASGLPLWSDSVVLSCSDPYLAMAIVCEKFAPHLSTCAYVPGVDSSAGLKAAEVHPTAVVDASAVLGPGCVIGAHCVIEKGARIGARTVLYPGCVVGPDCTIGEDGVFFARVTLYEKVHVGNRVRLHSGVVLGSDGFGYAPRVERKKPVAHQKIYHLGRVVVEDDVEIGANSAVDRATLGVTRIASGAKLDNLVHIGHNASVGEGAIICGGTCLAGNAVVGKFVTVGGLVGVTNHVHLGDYSRVAAMTLVSKDVPPSGTAVGNPQREHREHFKAHALLSKLLEDRRVK